jgi:hypothetical protein
MGAGLGRVATGGGLLPDGVALVAGAAAAIAIGVAAGRTRARAGAPWPWAPVAFTLVPLAPAFAAGWIVGARYFYLPSAGLAWAAGEALAAAGALPRAAALAAVLALGAAQTVARRADVISYEARLRAARQAVAAGAREGHRVFHVRCDIKDLDLAVKEDPALRGWADRVLVLSDVPASFALVPGDLAAAARILVAEPPLPPSGAYRFGGARIVGLARDGDDPPLADVIDRFPDIRFIRLRADAGGAVGAVDVTDQVRSAAR